MACSKLLTASANVKFISQTLYDYIEDHFNLGLGFISGFIDRDSLRVRNLQDTDLQQLKVERLES